MNIALIVFYLICIWFGIQSIIMISLFMKQESRYEQLKPLLDKRDELTKQLEKTPNDLILRVPVLKEIEQVNRDIYKSGFLNIQKVPTYLYIISIINIPIAMMAMTLVPFMPIFRSVDTSTPLKFSSDSIN